MVGSACSSSKVKNTKVSTAEVEMDRPPPGTIKQGYLTKSPPLEKRGLKNWKKRWCMFTILGNTGEPSLKYFKNEEDSFYAPTPIKRVSLRNCKMIEVDLHHPSHKNIFAIHLPERVYYFSAPSRMEMNEWADSLCTNLGLNNPKSRSSTCTMPLTPPVNRVPLAEKSGTFPRSNVYGTHRPQPPEIPLPPIPPTSSPSPLSTSPLPPPPEIPLPPVPTDDLCSGPSRSPRSTSPLFRHQRAPSPFSDEVPPSLPPRQSLSPPFVDDIANRPPAPLPHAPGATRPAGPGSAMPPPLPPARNESTGGSSSSPPLSLGETENTPPPTPPPRQEIRQISRMSSRAENNIYVASC